MYLVFFLLFFFLHTLDDKVEKTQELDSTDSSSIKSSLIVSHFGKLLSLLSVLHREFLFIPTGIILLSIFYCSATNIDGNQFTITTQCLNEMHIFYMALSGVMLLFSILLAFATTMYFNDTQPDSALPWANCSIAVVLLKLLRKMIIIACVVLSFNVSGLPLIMLILLNIINCFSLGKIIGQLYMNDYMVHAFMLSFEGGFMWLCFVGLIERIFQVEAAHDVFSILAIPVSYLLLKSFIVKRTSELVYTVKVEYIPDQGLMEQYVSIMVRIFQGQSQCDNYILLQGVFASHIRLCNAIGCPCEEISRAMDQGGEESLSASTSVLKSVRAISIKQTIQRNLSIHSADIPLTDYNSINKKKFFEFMRSLIERALTTVTKTTRLYIQLAYIHFLYLENKFIALYDLMNAQDSKPSFFEEFLIYRLKYFKG